MHERTWPMSAELARCQRLCRAKLRQGSRSFFAASRLLPKPVRQAATAVYAFCREADDAIDNIATQTPLASGAYTAALAALNARLDGVYQVAAAGEAAQVGPVEQALLPVVHTYQLPRDLFAALLEGFCWDAAGRRYASLADLRMYAARVAGSVGVMMALLMGERRAAMLARASDLGVAMQLTNIARDIGEDARAGRIYLPLLWLEEVGLTPAMLQQLAQRPAAAWHFRSLSQTAAQQAMQQVTRRLLRAADVLYGRAEMGIGALPRNCRRSIYAARLIYADIGQRILAQDCNLQRRAVVPFWRKLYWLWRAAAARRWQAADIAAALPVAPCLEETAFLVRCVAPASASSAPAAAACNV